MSWADLGADIGWIDGGVDVRFGLPARVGRFFAGNLALGLRSGRPGPLHETKGTHSFWGRLEAYPLLAESASGSHRGVVALGLNGGVFFHQATALNDGAGTSSGLFPAEATSIFRREVRLETALGYCVRPRQGASVLIAVEPYWLVQGNDGSGGPVDSTYRQSWGVVFVLSGSLFLRAYQPPADVVEAAPTPTARP